MTDSDMTLLADCAALAPSVHNTQPWRIRIDGERLEIHADPERQLQFLDPTGRQLDVSCGAAAEFAYVAARSLGRDCAVDLLPDPHEPQLLARLTLGAARAATDDELALAAAIPRRYTDRGPYLDQPVPPQLLLDAQTRAADLGVWLRLIDRNHADRSVVVEVLADAEAAETADPRYAEELARWTTTGAADEGMPLAAVASSWPDERVSDVPLRDFLGHNAHPRPGEHPDQPPPTVERDTLALLGTAEDDAASWLSAGRALGWLLLRCAVDGVSAQPLGPVIDLPSARGQLRRELGLVGHPQFLLRLGYGSGRPRTHRRTSAGTSPRS